VATIALQGVSKTYPGGHVALRDIDLEIADGELLALVGPSGCGKSSLLRLIAGLETPTTGRIVIDGRDVTETDPQSRDLAMVFQSYALYPHMTVYDNLAYTLRVRGTDRQEIQARITATSRTLGLDGLLDRRPSQLSGGQRQRVALGRAIVREPKAFLFDEPLSNLDPALRGQARAELLALRERLRATMVYVTHDQEEAMTLGTHVAVMCDGRIVQMDRALTVYHQPVNTFVATFIGSPPMNLLPATALRIQAAPGTLVGIRPQDLIVGTDGLTAHVDVVETRGPDAVVHLRLSEVDSPRLLAVVRGTPPSPGARVGLGWDGQRVLTFAPSGDAVRSRDRIDST
jgi:ABC-type sugar transport system ATPase subunit